MAGMVAAAVGASASPAPPRDGYERLLAFYKDFRAFQKPRFAGGMPDYSAAAMAAQQEALGAYKSRLAAIDPGAWPIPRQKEGPRPPGGPPCCQSSADGPMERPRGP